MIRKQLLLLAAALAFSAQAALAQQQRHPDCEQYIARYKDIAVEQMRKYKIPASITLAQGILESGAGKGRLAQRSNNHFGIKRGADWQGPTVTHDDDRRGEHFRVYSRVEDSFEDHSKFLHKTRYERLFRLNITDYKGWARGLKACGYATSPTYADRLIGIIELYGLQNLDEDPNAPRYVYEERTYEDVRINHRNILTNNDLLCVVAKPGDTWESLAQELKMKRRKLLSVNEAVEELPVRPGQYVYLEKKKTKGPKEMKDRWHKIEQGESMYSISQRYGIRLENLYKLNFKDADYDPAPGDLLRVR